jgi:hypothetical protein
VCQVWEAAVSYVISEISSYIEPDSFGIILFQPKIFRSKLVDFNSLDSRRLPNHVSKTKPPKIFRLKWPKARTDEVF